MPFYMTQTMSCGDLPVKRYYRQQTSQHVSHRDSGAFTQAAKADYAAFNNIDQKYIREG